MPLKAGRLASARPEVRGENCLDLMRSRRIEETVSREILDGANTKTPSICQPPIRVFTKLFDVRHLFLEPNGSKLISNGVTGLSFSGTLQRNSQDYENGKFDRRAAHMRALHKDVGVVRIGA